MVWTEDHFQIFSFESKFLKLYFGQLDTAYWDLRLKMKMLFQVYPDCQTLYHRLFLSQSRQALESVRWDLQSQVKVRGGSYNIK